MLDVTQRRAASHAAPEDALRRLLIALTYRQQNDRHAMHLLANDMHSATAATRWNKQSTVYGIPAACVQRDTAVPLLQVPRHFFNALQNAQRIRFSIARVVIS